MQQIVTWK